MVLQEFNDGMRTVNLMVNTNFGQVTFIAQTQRNNTEDFTTIVWCMNSIQATDLINALQKEVEELNAND